MEKYKDMTYTIRKDGRFAKKVTIEKKPNYLISNNVKDLYKQYIELKYNSEKGSVITKCKFKKCAEDWLKVNSAGKSENTIKEYKYIINKYLLPYFGKMNVSNIKKHDIEILQADLLEKKHNELAQKCTRFMNAILNDAIANDNLTKNPCTGIKKIKVIHGKRKILTSEQDKKLLASNHKHAIFFRVLRYIGMRRQEIVPLEPDDIDLDNKIIMIYKAVSFAKNQPTLKTTKNKKSRKVPIPDIIYNELKERVEYCRKHKLKYLFYKQTNNNSMLSQEAIRCMTDSFCKDIGFEFTPHQLRHSYCTMLYYAGIGLKEAQSLMGHSSAKMVYDIYTHLDAEKETPINPINDYLNNEQKVGKKVGKKYKVIRKLAKTI